MRALLVLLVVSAVACAAPRTSAPPAAVAERQILDIERAWDVAEVRHDGAALDAIFDDHFILTYCSEEPIDKATVIKMVLANDDPSSSTPTEQHVTVDGDIAIATGVDTMNDVGKPVKRANRYTTTFAYRDGRWRALSVHLVPIPSSVCAHESQ